MPLAVENPFIFCYTARIDCYLAISPPRQRVQCFMAPQRIRSQKEKHFERKDYKPMEAADFLPLNT